MHKKRLQLKERLLLEVKLLLRQVQDGTGTLLTQLHLNLRMLLRTQSKISTMQVVKSWQLALVFNHVLVSDLLIET
jgi:hypothetical protein